MMQPEETNIWSKSLKNIYPLYSFIRSITIEPIDYYIHNLDIVWLVSTGSITQENPM